MEKESGETRRTRPPCGSLEGGGDVSHGQSKVYAHIHPRARREVRSTHGAMGVREGVYEEFALYGVTGGTVTFWSFTSDGKHSEGTIADGSDIHEKAITFEAELPAGRARMTYWPDEVEGFHWTVEAKTKKGWSRFTDHHYTAVTGT